MIVHTKERVSGQLLDGYRISCHNGPQKQASGQQTCSSNFLPSSAKHLPPEVVEKKFQQRGWEVNSNQRDFCPECIARRRAPKKKLVGRAGAAEILVPRREATYANAHNLRKLVTSCGLIVHDVIELEHRHSRFKITFRNTPEIQIGRLTYVEGEVLSAFNAALIGSSLKNELDHSIDKTTHHLEIVTHWYLTLQMMKAANSETDTLQRPQLVAAE